MDSVPHFPSSEITPSFVFFPPAVELPDNLPFPDGEEVSPEIIVEALPGTCCHKSFLLDSYPTPTKYGKFSLVRHPQKYSTYGISVPLVASINTWDSHYSESMQQPNLLLQTGVGGFARFH